MRTMKQILALITLSTLLLLAVATFAQSNKKTWYLVCTEILFNKIEERDCLDKMYNAIYNDNKGYIEVKSDNPKYTKIWLQDAILGGFSSYSTSYSNGFVKEPNKKTNGNGSYSFLYKAYVELAPDASGQKKAQLFLFFSHYNAGFNGKKKPSFAKEVLADMYKNPIILAELNPDKYVEVYEYANSTAGGLKKAYATTTSIYDAKSLYPDKQPKLTGNKYDFKLHLTGKDCYEKSTQINYNDHGNPTELIEFFSKEGGYTLSMKRSEKLDENGKVKEVNFNNAFGMDLTNNKVYYNTNILVPSGVKKQWPADIQKFNTTPDLLGDIRTNTGIEPIEDTAQLKEFLTNFQRLNEYVIIEPTEKNVNKFPKKHIYKGTYNQDGMPHGWGLIYAANEYNDEYYLGHFKNGMPDGFGIRHNFKLDKPETVYSSSGMHVGNTLIYGSKTTRAANNYGYNVVYGDIRTGALNGKGNALWYSGSDNGVGWLYDGYFQNGKLHGEGGFYRWDKKEVGIFSDGSLIAGDKTADKMDDFWYAVGSVVLYKGNKYVIMKKEKGMFVFDNGFTVSTKADVTLTGERSVQNKACLICNGTGYLSSTTNTVFSGVTKTKKSYEVGTTGYVTWEKTTTTTTAPVTATSGPRRCTGCSGGSSGSVPVPLKR